MLYSRGLFVPLGGASFPSPNMQYAYMASGSYASTPNETVNLSYHPCFSAVEVKLVKPEIMTSRVRLKEEVLALPSKVQTLPTMQPFLIRAISQTLQTL